LSKLFDATNTTIEEWGAVQRLRNPFRLMRALHHNQSSLAVDDRGKQMA
jgi:hypothetical protein